MDMDNRKLFEEGLLQAMDTLAERSGENTTKMLAELLKSAILKPYQNTPVCNLTSSPSIQYAITVTSIAQPSAHSPKTGQHWTLLQRSRQTF